jgi:transcriptional regulator GlxA family with amidase domain
MARTFAFLVLPEVHLLDLAGPDQAILEAIGYGADFKIAYCGIGNEAISSAGLKFAQTQHFSALDLQPGDFLILPGSNVGYLSSATFAQQTDLFAWIQTLYRNGVRLVSICAGAFILGKCGLLDGIECTTHFKQTQRLQRDYPQAIVRENVLFVQQNGIHTSAGIAAGIDLVLSLIEQIMGSYFAHKVAREMVVYSRRDGQSKQLSAFLDFRNHIHAGIHKAQDHIIENIQQKNSLPALAEIACMSERNFTRVFKKETGITVNEFVNSIRREKIQSLLNNPDLSRQEIARQVGLESEKQVRRLLQA